MKKIGIIFLTLLVVLSSTSIHKDFIKKEVLANAVTPKKCTDVSSCESMLNELSMELKSLSQKLLSTENPITIKQVQDRVEYLKLQVSNIQAQRIVLAQYLKEINQQEIRIEEKQRSRVQQIKERIQMKQFELETNSSLKFIADSSSFTDFLERNALVTSLNEQDTKEFEDYEASKLLLAEMRKKEEALNLYLTSLASSVRLILIREEATLKKFKGYDAAATANNSWGVFKLTEDQKIQVLSKLDTIPITDVTQRPLPLTRATITSPYAETEFHSTPHSGTDIGPRNGDYRLASMVSGVVVANRGGGARGNLIAIAFKTSETTYRIMLYQHMSQLSSLTIGAEVAMGQIVGFAGNTGYSFGVHLHVEVSDALMDGLVPLWSDNNGTAGPGLYATETYFNIPYSW